MTKRGIANEINEILCDVYRQMSREQLKELLKQMHEIKKGTDLAKKIDRYTCVFCKHKVTDRQMRNGEGTHLVGGQYRFIQGGVRVHEGCYGRVEAHLFRG